ncbi:MAG: hypothetical protein ABSD92_09155 [Candidatus Bathyarchaeia archaeon]|jgi:hypothetical protein
MKVSVIVIIALVVIASIVAALLAINLAKLTSNAVPAANAQSDNAGYVNTSRLFLVSAKATYGMHNGQACFIINATVRNDYTAQQPPPMDNFPGNSSGTAYFGLTAKLYDKTGLIASSDVTSPGSAPLGVTEIGLDSGQTYTVEIDMATSSRNVDNYSINILDIAGYPIP